MGSVFHSRSRPAPQYLLKITAKCIKMTLKQRYQPIKSKQNQGHSEMRWRCAYFRLSCAYQMVPPFWSAPEMLGCCGGSGHFILYWHFVLCKGWRTCSHCTDANAELTLALMLTLAQTTQQWPTLSSLFLSMLSCCKDKP